MRDPGRYYRVAMVAPCCFPSLRGSQVLILDLAQRLTAEGHAVHIVTYPVARAPIPDLGAVVHRAPRIPGLWTTRPLGWQKILLDLLLIGRLWSVVRRQKIDLIHAHNLEGPLVGYLVRFLTRVPVVYHAHNALCDELPHYMRVAWMKRWMERLGAFLDRRVAAAADFSIAPTERLGAFLAARGTAGRIAVIPPAATVGRRQVRVGRESTGRPLIMYAGNLDPYQDLDVLLAGFARIRAQEPGARLVVVTHEAKPRGSAIERALEREPGVAIRFASDFAAVTESLARADVLVCPRSSWSGFPIKVLNYMSLGLPIVHARGSAHGIEDGRSGLLFDDGDPKGLAEAVLRVIRNPVLARGIGRGARRVSKERYGWERVLPAILAIYWEVSGQRDMERPAGVRRGLEQLTERLMIDMGTSIKRHVRGRGRVLVTKGVSLLAVIILGVMFSGCAAGKGESTAPLPPLTAVPALTGEEITPDYRLLPGDVLRVKFLYHPDLDLKTPVGPDGNISLQQTGELRAEGLTVDALAREIEHRSSDRLRDPSVAVIVAEVGQHRVYVGGEVKFPGFVFYREGMTPLQAIFDRGGFTDVARMDSVLKISGMEATRLDLSETINKGNPEFTSLAANDVLYIPRTFIGDANTFVRLYFRNLVPMMPRVGIGFSP